MAVRLIPNSCIIAKIWLALGLSTADLQADSNSLGYKTYQMQCADCHGKKGQGVKDEYNETLTGDWSLEKLTRYIDKAMPDDDPKLCAGKEAKLVAEYIYEAFYSPEAQLRNNPPQASLARLTARQYEISLADIMVEFLGKPPLPGEKQGLNAEYFNDRGYNSKKLVYKRVDPRVDFNFGEGVPEQGKFDPKAFAIKWNGSIFAPETGIYEFIIVAENGCRLYVNDKSSKLIDAWVATRKKTEHKAEIKLVGGRLYPLTLEFFKYKGKNASIRLEWRPPHGNRETIPTEALFPQGSASTYVVNTHFPPDDTSAGYRRGTLVTKAWAEATTFAAVELATYVSLNLDRIARTKPDDPERKKKIRDFCHKFVGLAFRHPLDEVEKKQYVDLFLEKNQYSSEGVRRVILLALKSPKFLYPGLDDDPENSRTIASRMALAMWDSIPDNSLYNLASRDLLTKDGHLQGQATRMVRDPRTKTKLLEFFHHWLELHRDEYLSKDAEDFPGFGLDLINDMRTSLDKFINEVVWEDPSADYRNLIRADYVYANQRIAKFFKSKHQVSGESFEKLQLDGAKRAGVLTHPYLLTQFSYSQESSPIHRGVFLTRNILGRQIKPPAEAVIFKDEDFNPDLTMREKVEKMTSPSNCQGCHSTINALGFALEGFDALGRYRERIGNKHVNTQTTYETYDGKKMELKSASDIAEIAVNSPVAQDRFIEMLFQHATKQPLTAYGPNAASQLRQNFQKNEYNIQKLFIDICVLHATMKDKIQLGVKTAQN